ncbi:Chlamydia polymorphic membrane protein (Chlamydia_PMP) [Planctomycetes bacterium Poly30]|uniref:Chlamydia polymorphic membrane protein (Chlamydia_PMP) n=1 Tax=Saltatorellus ferox TaxID=2528018 RepID=A0A518EV50_9BACT|nr:Chlamydia polymorphic membrane protein (Chlamydia_PMP) [Planctomycetes bacterium Poly30]
MLSSIPPLQRAALAALSLSLLASSLQASAAGQTILRVNGSLTTGANDGTTWPNAFRGPHALNAALAAAGSLPGSSSTKVFVAEGTYTPSDTLDRSASFVISGTVLLFGGFRGDEPTEFFRPARGFAPTILSGDLQQDDTQPFTNRDDNAYHVVRVTDTGWGTLDGFTVRGGHADDPAAPIGLSGGGLFCEGRCAVVDCLFEDNFASLTGGAIYSRIAPLQVMDSDFLGNQAGDLTPTPSPVGGGAVYFAGPASLTYDMVIAGCRFELNRTAGDGAALYLGPSGHVVNSIFFRNFGASGSAIWLQDSSGQEPRIMASTVTRNSTGALSGFAIDGSPASGVLAVSQSILWGNISTPVGQSSLNPLFLAENSIIEGGGQGTGIHDVDPLFVDLMQGDLALAAGSPALDAANDSLLPQIFRRADAQSRRRAVDDPGAANTGTGGAFMDFGALERSTAISGVTRTCFPAANSTGDHSKVDAFGSPSVAQNALTLTAVDLPTGAFGYFIVSRTTGFVVNPGGGPGNLCIVGNIGRLIGPGQVQNSGLSGVISTSMDLTAIPTTTGFLPGEPGDTWHFQAWHRDLTTGGPTSFFTDAAFVTLIP